MSAGGSTACGSNRSPRRLFHQCNHRRRFRKPARNVPSTTHSAGSRQRTEQQVVLNTLTAWAGERAAPRCGGAALPWPNRPPPRRRAPLGRGARAVAQGPARGRGGVRRPPCSEAILVRARGTGRGPGERRDRPAAAGGAAEAGLPASRDSDAADEGTTSYARAAESAQLRLVQVRVNVGIHAIQSPFSRGI